jgi:lipoyl(octanoyl) transferase
MSLENAVIELMKSFDVEAVGRRDAPGIYVDGRKLASIGLRIRRGCSYHGLAFNITMDLGPFSRINPCGYQGLEVIDMHSLGIETDVESIAQRFAPHLLRALNLPSDTMWISVG